MLRLLNTSQMKFAPFTVVFLLFCLFACKENDKKLSPLPLQKQRPAQLEKPDLDREEPSQKKDRNSLILDSLKPRTASL